MTRDELFDKLDSMGIVVVEVEFSGGNDEGGVDNITFLTENGLYNGPLPQNPPVRQEYSTKQYVVGWGREQRPASPDEVRDAEFWSAIEDPIYKEWGSFAGEFSVHGTLTFNVPGRAAILKQDVQRDYDHECRLV